jgi:hypothetical protein
MNGAIGLVLFLLAGGAQEESQSPSVESHHKAP